MNQLKRIMNFLDKNGMDKIKNINTRLGYIIVVTFWVIILMALTSCHGTYYLTDSEYSDAREESASITYYNNQIYSGWNNGYYYYYGKPHYYPWHYYYNTCPPSHYTHTTHVVITRPVNRPTVRPVKSNTTIRVKTNRTNKVTVKPNRNRTNNKVINRRRPK